MILSARVVPATFTVTVAPGTPVPESVLSVDFTPATVILPVACNVGVTAGLGTANTYFSNCPPLLSVTVLAPELYVSALSELTSLSVYPFAFIFEIAFCTASILFKLTT